MPRQAPRRARTGPRRADKGPAPTDWHRRPQRPASMPPDAFHWIVRRRRQILVHSYLYYEANTTLVDDPTWTLWAQQLARLQRKYGWRVGFYDQQFRDWDGSSGFHLKYDWGVINVARRLLHHQDELDNVLN